MCIHETYSDYAYKCLYSHASSCGIAVESADSSFELADSSAYETVGMLLLADDV